MTENIFVLQKKIIIASLVFVLATAGIATAKADDMDARETNRCSRYFAAYEHTFHMPHNLLRAVSVTESGIWSKEAGRKIAWPWTINVQGKGYRYDSKQEAIAAVKQFQSQGIKSIDVGCMQINLKYHPDAFHNLEQAFEPKYNIGYAAQMLKDKHDIHRDWKTAIKMYHNADPSLGNTYIAKVYDTWRTEDRGFTVASLGIPSEAMSVRNRDINIAPDVSDITRSALQMFGVE